MLPCGSPIVLNERFFLFIASTTLWFFHLYAPILISPKRLSSTYVTKSSQNNPHFCCSTKICLLSRPVRGQIVRQYGLLGCHQHHINPKSPRMTLSIKRDKLPEFMSFYSDGPYAKRGAKLKFFDEYKRKYSQVDIFLAEIDISQ